MLFDAWLLRRFRADPREQRRFEIARLTELGVSMTELGLQATRRLYDRFIEQFVDAEHAGALRAHLESAEASERSIEITRWLRADRVRRGGPLGCARWLGEGGRAARCVRFERRASLPALEIDLGTLDDAWAASWPGVFVNFDAGRAVAISLDYEDVRCDVRAAPATPYR